MLGALLLLPAAPVAGRVFVIDDFSAPAAADGLPLGWKHLTFKKIKRRTRYSVVKDGEAYAVRAVSERSASALAREVSVNLSEFPTLNWSWKVSGVLPGADGSRKSGDDYPARVYVAFAYDPAQATRWEKATYGLLKAVYGAYPPKATLSYVWDAHGTVGSSWDNVYTSRVKMVVVESGPARAGRWVSASRDVLADYRRLVGGEPPPIAYIGLMSDSDDTKGSVTAWFGRLYFSNGDVEEFN